MRYKNKKQQQKKVMRINFISKKNLKMNEKKYFNELYNCSLNDNNFQIMRKK